MSSVMHYNRVALHAPVQCGAMRLAHNRCKSALIQRAVATMRLSLDQCRVLDLACGRGGDLNKLKGCKAYVGIDTAGVALEELSRRSTEIGMSVELHQADASTVPAVPCEIVLCNFALHYFCDIKPHCAALLDVAAGSLVPGGTFCGTYERVHGDVAWGVQHHAVVGDCVDAIEWRVPWHEVVSMALSRGLALVWHAPFHMYDSDSDGSILGFIFQKQARVQCYDTPPKRSSTAGNRGHR